MQKHDRSRKTSGPSFWRSTPGLILIGFLAIAGLLLVLEHRAHIFTSDVLLIGLLAFCVLMHLFMHGGHGGGKGGGHRS